MSGRLAIGWITLLIVASIGGAQRWVSLSPAEAAISCSVETPCTYTITVDFSDNSPTETLVVFMQCNTSSPSSMTLGDGQSQEFTVESDVHCTPSETTAPSFYWRDPSASTCDGIDFPAANGGSCTIVMNPVAELNVTKDFTNDPEPGPTVDISFSCPDSDHVQATGSTTLGDGGVVSYYIYYVGTSVTCPAPTEITTNAPGYVENGPNGDADCADLPDNVTTFTGAGVVSTGQVSCTFTNSPEDNIAPTVTINQGGSQSDPTSTSPIDFDVVFSEPVTGFDASDVNLSSSTAPGTLVAVVTGGPANYMVSVSGMTGSGTVVASIGAGAAQDGASNPSQASTSTDNSVTYEEPDNIAPTVTIDQGGSQSDPTSTSPIDFDVMFSEPVTGFDASDVNLSSSTAPGTLVAVVTGGPANYTVSVSGMTGSGTVVASIGAGAAQDGASNPSEASTSTDNSVTYEEPDNIAPTVTIDQGGSQSDPTSTSPIDFDVVFSEPVTGFDASDVNLSGSTAPGTLVAVVTGGPANYTVSVSGMTGSGTVVASIGAGAAQDGASNPSEASTSTDNSVTYEQNSVEHPTTIEVRKVVVGD